MIYLIVFAISCLFIAIGEKKKRNRLLLFFGLALPILLATMRAETVGNDISTYVKPIYENAKVAGDFTHFVALNRSDLATRDLEFGFSLISYWATKITGGLWGLFLAYDLIMVLGVFFAINVYNQTEIGRKKKIKIWIAMYVYYMVFYNMSLTMIRQSLACTLVLLGAMLFIHKKIIKSIICIIAASLFHSTALLGIPIIAIYIVLQCKKVKIQGAIWVIGIIIFVLGGKGYWVVLNFLNRFISVPGRYMSYAYMWLQGEGVNLAWLFLISISVITAWYSFKKDKSLINHYLLYLALWSVFLFPLSVASANAGRVEYYFMYFTVLSIPMMKYAFSGARLNGKKADVYMVLVFGLIYWLGTTGLNDYTGTSDYIFAFLK